MSKVTTGYTLVDMVPIIHELVKQAYEDLSYMVGNPMREHRIIQAVQHEYRNDCLRRDDIPPSPIGHSAGFINGYVTAYIALMDEQKGGN